MDARRCPPSFAIICALSVIFGILSSTAGAQEDLNKLKDCTQFEHCFSGAKPNSAFRMTHSPRSSHVIVLIHGLSDSPYFMKDVALRFFQRGYDVIAPMLDGHGTKPADLLRVTSKQWISTSEHWFNVAQKGWRNVSLGGFSTGGILSLRLAAVHPKKIQNVVLFVPAIKIANKNAYQACPYTQVSKGAEHLPGPTKVVLEAPLKMFKADREWINPERPTTEVKYGPMTTASVCALYKLTRKSREYLSKIKAPIVAVVSADDTTTDAMEAMIQLSASSSPSVKIQVLGSSGSYQAFATRAQTLMSQRAEGLSISVSNGPAVEHGSMPVQFNAYNKELMNPQFNLLESFVFGTP